VTTLEQLQSAVEHLAIALNLLDQSGAELTAAHVDGAIMCLRSELQMISWHSVLQLDYSDLDAMIDEACAKHIPMLISMET